MGQKLNEIIGSVSITAWSVGSVSIHLPWQQRSGCPLFFVPKVHHLSQLNKFHHECFWNNLPFLKYPFSTHIPLPQYSLQNGRKAVTLKRWGTSSPWNSTTVIESNVQMATYLTGIHSNSYGLISCHLLCSFAISDREIMYLKWNDSCIL